MDPYERLAAINEALGGEKPESTLSFSKAYDKKKKILKAIDKAGNSTENYKKVAARLAAHYDNLDNNQFGDSAFGRSIVGESTEKIDQEFGAAKKALKDAGIEHDSLQAIGSLDREKNTFKIAQKDMRRAREVLKNFPNAQIKRA
mgnify:CR=1 FL=1